MLIFYEWAFGDFSPSVDTFAPAFAKVNMHTYIYRALSWWPWRVLLITVPPASITAVQTWPADQSLSLSPCFTHLHPYTYMHTHPPMRQSCDACIFTPPRYKYHYAWLYLLPSHQGCRWPTLITLIKTEMCVFLCVCGWGLWCLITPRWILIPLWWDTKHHSQSSNALAANQVNEYILFWPFSELFFVFHITFPLPHYSLSVLALFYIHTLPFNTPCLPASSSLQTVFFFTNSSFLLTSLYLFGRVFLPCCTPLLLSSRCITSTVKTKKYSRNLELVCLYSERSQVRSVEWKHHNKSRNLIMSSSSPGIITTKLPLPITSDIAGNYSCVLSLENGQVMQATQAVTVPAKGGKDLSKGWCVFRFSLGSLLYTAVLADFLSTWG